MCLSRRHCAIATWNCLISRFVEDSNTKKRLSLSFLFFSNFGAKQRPRRSRKWRGPYRLSSVPHCVTWGSSIGFRTGTRDFPYLKHGIRDLKVKLGRVSGLKVSAGGGMPKISLGITRLHEILGRDNGIEEPYCELGYPGSWRVTPPIL